ncbi:immunoglobulin-binding protein 1-like [Acropora muricata]|uniref:immunoglobulin-binding protein 1-like n=1 Tax=Acropora muricata TaxID=159855 RepID=UPI0034E4CE99
MAAAEECSDERSLKTVFEEGYLLHGQIEDDETPSNSDVFQKKVSEAVIHFVRATEMVNSLGLFSSNEELAEVPTSELRYFLLPAFLGDLFLRQMLPDRKTVLNIAKVYFMDFLKRCKNYGVTDIDLSKYTEDSNSPCERDKSLNQMANSRQEKIARYKEQKEQERKLKELQKILNDATKSVLDEDTQRCYYTLLLKFWVNKVVEHLSSLLSEMEILEHMKTVKKDEKHNHNADRAPPPKTLQPILITREMTKAKVFGAGYPSVPTMMQEEFLEKEILEGKVVLDFEDNQTKSKSKEHSEESDSEEDPAKLQKQRDWDEWKDDHRRGWGNRENMG